MISPNDVLVFDLDGTLVQSVAFDDLLYREAVSEVLGRSDFDGNWETYTHVTDSGLLTEILSRLEIPFQPAILSAVRELFRHKVEAHLKSVARCDPLPGARETIEVLRGAGVPFGIATGGWAPTARMKLTRAGLDPVEVLVSSDHSPSRTEIMQRCLHQLGVGGRPVVYLGDGPWDLEATRSLGWKFIGVGPRLAGDCDPWIEDYEDPRWRAALAELAGAAPRSNDSTERPTEAAWPNP